MASHPAADVPEGAYFDFVRFVADMSRFLVDLSNAPMFSSGQIGLIEWLVLSILSEQKAMNTEQLAEMLGMERHRVDQISAGLAKSGFVFPMRPVQKSQGVGFKLTRAGNIQRIAVNRQLQPVLAGALSRHQGAFNGTARQIRLMSKLVTRTVSPAKRKAAQQEKK